MLLQLVLLLLIFVIATPAFAVEIFHPNCTISIKPVKLVTSPEVCGTFDILWTVELSFYAFGLHLEHPTSYCSNSKAKRNEIMLGRVEGHLSWKGMQGLRGSIKLEF